MDASPIKPGVGSRSFLHDTYIRKIMPAACLPDETRQLMGMCSVHLSRKTGEDPMISRYHVKSADGSSKFMVTKVSHDFEEKDKPAQTGGWDTDRRDISILVQQKGGATSEGYLATVYSPGGNTVGYMDRCDTGFRLVNANEDVVFHLQTTTAKPRKSLRCVQHSKVTYKISDKNGDAISASVHQRAATIRVDFGEKMKLQDRVLLIGAGLVLAEV